MISWHWHFFLLERFRLRSQEKEIRFAYLRWTVFILDGPLSKVTSGCQMGVSCFTDLIPTAVCTPFPRRTHLIDSTVGLCLGPFDGRSSRRKAFSHERGTPVLFEVCPRNSCARWVETASCRLGVHLLFALRIGHFRRDWIKQLTLTLT